MVEPKQASPGAKTRRPRTKISAALMEEEEGDLNKHWRKYFLAALAETSNVTAAAAIAGAHPSRAYKVRRLDPEFARKWQTALLEGYQNLELEVLYRLRFGEAKDGAVKFDNANALRLLGLHRENVARERAMRENEDVAVVRAAIDAKLEQLRRQVVARRSAETKDAANG
ncbi:MULTISPECIES: hypothetical protein [Novosphingobium]|jgi:hypothetical protein|uniref:hypothetical protein n=1 Tax=Novosphingobium TaxID=165696 RepID=UPI0022F29179|nr:MULTISPECIES: hypothetical protein [Novosphingobium]GLK42166.1 hypothetical protein GCM10017612_00830 [Novosphingobium resinovorum]